MGFHTGAPINEAVYLIKKADSSALPRLLESYPALAEELAGMEGGGLASELDKDRARVMLIALEFGQSQAEATLSSVRLRLQRARLQRLAAQVFGLLTSSGAVAAVVAQHRFLALVTATLTFIASLASLGADHLEALFRPGAGNAYRAYEAASALVFKASRMHSELRLLLLHDADAKALSATIGLANAVCEELNKLTVQLGVSAVPGPRSPVGQVQPATIAK